MVAVVVVVVVVVEVIVLISTLDFTVEGCPILSTRIHEISKQ